MTSRRIHALLVTLPAVGLAAGAVVLATMMAEAVLRGGDADRAVLVGLFAWPMAVAAVSFLARAVCAVRDSGRPDPVRTLGITPVGGAWRIPVRRRHPLSTACLVVSAAGVLMAALTALGVLASPAWWHLAVSVGGSLVIGWGSLAVASVLDRDGRASMVLEPREQVLILPRAVGRPQVVRVALGRVRSVMPERQGPLGLLQRVSVEFDDELLGRGVRQVLLRGVDPGRAMDLTAWLRGWVASAGGTPAAPAAPAASTSPGRSAAPSLLHATTPAAVVATAAAPPPVAHVHASPAAPPSAAPHVPAAAHAGIAPAPHAAAAVTMSPRRAPRRGAAMTALIGRVNMPAALSGLGLACVLALVAMGVRIDPRSSVARPVAATPEPAVVGVIGTSIDGDPVTAEGLGAPWIWVIEASPASGVSDQQVGVLGPLRERFRGAARFRVVLVAGERAGEQPDARLAQRYAARHGLPPGMVLLRPESGVPVPRHRLLTADGRVVHEATGFMSGGSIERQIGVRQAAARMEERP